VTLVTSRVDVTSEVVRSVGWTAPVVASPVIVHIGRFFPMISNTGCRQEAGGPIMAKETIPSLHNAFLGRPLDTNIWESDAFIGGRIRTEGEPACSSANWCTTACAVALYAGRPYARGWWMQYFDQAAHRFMGKEPFSRIYAH
jgi:hypothetical protein